MHHAERVLEARMHRSGIDHVGPRELPDATQPLEGRMIYDVALEAVEGNEPVDRIADFVLLERHGPDLVEFARSTSRAGYVGPRLCPHAAGAS